jgi:hypothetical protein
MLLLSSSKLALPWPFVFWLIMLVAVVAMPLISWWRKLRTQSWPAVQGKIVDTAIHERPVQSGIWTADLVYSCKVEGQVHAGRYKRNFDNLEEAQEFVRGLKDRSIAIHYCPSNPSHSALDEQDLRTLLEQRPPAPPELLQVTALPVSLWVKIFAYPLMAVAAAGFAMSLYVHISSLLGSVSVSQGWVFILHLGMFVVFGPGILAMSKTGYGRSISRRQLAQLPATLRYSIYVFGIYAMINFAIFWFRTADQPKHGSQGAPPWRGFSGHWMLFYLLSIALLYLGTHPKNVTAVQRSDGN